MIQYGATPGVVGICDKRGTSESEPRLWSIQH